MKILITGGSGFIGTNLIEEILSSRKYSIVNLDSIRPKIKSHEPYWKYCDILNEQQVQEVISSFKPDAVIHMAARTDTDPRNVLDDYQVNIKGSENVLKAIQHSREIKRVIFTSTQFVNQYNGLPKTDIDFAPHTVYGESKVIMEKMIRSAELGCVWTIIRPTNIWGPWHIRYPYEFWRVLSKGLYFHPGRQPVMRSYGYVGNVVFQILAILESEADKVNRKIFYVGDSPIDLYKWVNGFSLGQVGRKVTIVPKPLVKLLALCGDFLAMFKVKFPITSSRYMSMTHSNETPMERTFETLGNPPYSLEEGIAKTLDWMRETYPDLIKKK